AKVHAIVAREQLAQGEPEMTRNRFGFLERHGCINDLSSGYQEPHTRQRRQDQCKDDQDPNDDGSLRRHRSHPSRSVLPWKQFDNRSGRHHTCLASRISMTSTHGSLRQRLAVRSASAQLAAHSAWPKAATPLGHNLLGGCPTKWITTQCE